MTLYLISRLVSEAKYDLASERNDEISQGRGSLMGKAILRVCFAFRPGSRVYTCGLKAHIHIKIALINLMRYCIHRYLVPLI